MQITHVVSVPSKQTMTIHHVAGTRVRSTYPFIVLCSIVLWEWRCGRCDFRRGGDLSLQRTRCRWFEVGASTGFTPCSTCARIVHGLPRSRYIINIQLSTTRTQLVTLCTARLQGGRSACSQRCTLITTQVNLIPHAAFYSHGPSAYSWLGNRGYGTHLLPPVLILR